MPALSVLLVAFRMVIQLVNLTFKSITPQRRARIGAQLPSHLLTSPIFICHQTSRAPQQPVEMAKKRKRNQKSYNEQDAPSPARPPSLTDLKPPEIEGAHLYTDPNNIPWDIEP